MSLPTSADGAEVAEPSAALEPGAQSARIKTASSVLLELAFALLAGSWSLWLEWRSVFETRTFGFDTTLYARSLWGVANGSFYNSFAKQWSFLIHAHLVDFALAPFARLMPAAAVLTIAQAVAFAVTIFLVLRAVRHYAVLAGRPQWSPLRTLTLGALLVLGAPFFTNAFLFDPRPDVIAVPFLLAATLRIMKRNAVDLWSLVLLACAVAVREEFGLAAAFALILLPRQVRENGVSKHVLWAFAIAAAAWFVGYTLITHFMQDAQLRTWSLQIHMQGSVSDFDGDGINEMAPEPLKDPMVYLRSKAEILFALAAFGGGLCLLGWRWLGGAVPGLVFLLLTLYNPEQAFAMHYGMFASPALLAAAVAGYRRWLSDERTLPAWMYARWSVAGALAIGLSTFLMSSNFPGGGRFIPGIYDLLDKDGHWSLSNSRYRTEYAHVVKLLKGIPKEHGLVVSTIFAARLADRPHIYMTNYLGEYLTDLNKPIPSEFQTIALASGHFKHVGRILARRGYQLVGAVEPGGVVMTRDLSYAKVPWERMAAPTPPSTCNPPLAVWQGTGLALCHTQGQEGERGGAFIYRYEEATSRDAMRTVALTLQSNQGGGPLRAFLYHGWADLAWLPRGKAVWVQTDEATAGRPFDVKLYGLSGHSFTPTRVRGAKR